MLGARQLEWNSMEKKSKQATLFRSWGGKKPFGDGNSQPSIREKAPARSHTQNPPSQAASSSSSAGSTAAECVDLTEGERFGFKDEEELDRFFEDDVTEEIRRDTAHNSSILEEAPGFDPEAGEQWIYPTNYPMRDYQFNIAHKCLFRNTLVCLPTGLGKTFIAAVVMFNFSRWYPTGKVVFLAPTKPLVTQQIEACHSVMGIPQSHLAEMTGNLPPKERAIQWVSKKVFFLTPQVMQNDIAKGACPAELVRCVVFDEAHKALGNYSYCQVVKELTSRGVIFRVLALSATPGNDLKAVQQVVTNLNLSHIELRAEDSFDIQPYTHQRKVELHVVPLEGEILVLKEAFLEVLQGVVGRLAKFGVVYSGNPERLSKFGLLQARDGFRQGPPPSGVHPGTIEGDFATAISLYHAYDLLFLHGLRPFHHYLSHTFSSGSYPRAQQEIDRHPKMARLLRALQKKLTAPRSRAVGVAGRSPRSGHYTSPTQSSAPSVFYGHPKLKKLEEVVLDHFKTCSAQSVDGTARVETRVMIFSQYRESVQEIADLLGSHAPLVRAMSFVGHGTTSKSTSKGLTQREQLEVVRKFREGGYNTLVATCVGEEGLDIGEVDLIVCFDAHKSPIRLVQRMGRTGRKRSGRIVVIVAQGKEEQTYRKSQSNKSSIHKAIRQNSRSLHLFPHAPRMVPRHLTPQCLKTSMEVEQFKHTVRESKGKGRGKQPRLSFGPPALDAASRRGCLTHQELQEWSEMYSLPDRELRACERAVQDCYKPHPLLALSKLRRNRDSSISNLVDQNCDVSTAATPLNGSVVQKYTLSLNRWVRCQTVQTSFKMVGPSVKGRQFVSLLEFLDLMYSCEGLGESYATEMAAFLDSDDVCAGDGVTGASEVVRRRRRLPSDSSDDCDFREGVRSEAAVEEELSPSHPLDPPSDNDCSDDLNPDPISGSNDRVFPTASQHAIPQPPSCDSLAWLDSIEPTQVSTPLPSSPRAHPHTSHNFQFALPRTPPSSRKGKTLLVTPLTTPSQENQIQPHCDPTSDNHSTANLDSVDLFNDISSAVLFGEFSDYNSSRLPQPTERGEIGESSTAAVGGRASPEECGHVITSVPESEGEEENETSVLLCVSELGTSEERLIGGCRKRRRKFARPDFLLTQAPPTTPPTSQHSSSVATVDTESSDDDDFIEPLGRRLKRRRIEEGLSGERDDEMEPGEFVEREAELSGDGGETGEEEEVGGGEDDYDMEDSFINDNSVLTQVTPTQHTRGKQKTVAPANMADVYRQSLMSPDTIFGGRGRGNGYRIVLSERHKILRRCLEKAGGRRLFGVEERVTGDSGESEAEEVRVCYGEEDEEEIEGSQSIGEPWDWDEPQEVRQEMRQEVESEEMKRDESRFNSEDEIVSPTLVAVVEPHPTPACYNLEVEGWESDDSWCSEECPAIS